MKVSYSGINFGEFLFSSFLGREWLVELNWKAVQNHSDGACSGPSEQNKPFIPSAAATPVQCVCACIPSGKPCDRPLVSGGPQKHRESPPPGDISPGVSSATVTLLLFLMATCPVEGETDAACLSLPVYQSFRVTTVWRQCVSRRLSRDLGLPPLLCENPSCLGGKEEQLLC